MVSAAALLLSTVAPFNLPCCPPALGQQASESKAASRFQRPPVHSRSAESTDAVPGVQSAPLGALTLKSGVSYTVPKGTAMNLKITTVPTNGMRLLQKDLDGNPMPAQVNDVITATISEDIYVDGDRVIPEGTIFRGHVVNINGPRRVQRPGWVDIAFNELELPNHRIFRFRAQADNLEASTMKSKLNGVKMVAENAFGGAVVGTMVAYMIFGQQGTIHTRGINLAAGAAGGALLAAGHAIMKRGHSAWLEPGDGLNLAIDTDMVMPALQEPTKHLANTSNVDGLVVQVLKCKVVKDGIGGHFIRVDVNINNDSDKTLQAIDLYLKDSNGTKCPLSMGPEDDDQSAFLFHLEPYSTLRSRLYFAAEYPKLGHEFVWLDHETRKVCFRQKLEL